MTEPATTPAAAEPFKGVKWVTRGVLHQGPNSSVLKVESGPGVLYALKIWKTSSVSEDALNHELRMWSHANEHAAPKGVVPLLGNVRARLAKFHPQTVLMPFYVRLARPPLLLPRANATLPQAGGSVDQLIQTRISSAVPFTLEEIAFVFVRVAQVRVFAFFDMMVVCRARPWRICTTWM